MIDLSTCVYGQKVEYRNGTTGEYCGLNRNAVYPHITKTSNNQFRIHKQDGREVDRTENDYDVIEIYPLETPKEPSVIDLYTCIPGQKVEFRDGTMGEYVGIVGYDPIYPHLIITDDRQSRIHKQDGHYSRESNHEYDVVKIYPLETQMTDKSTESQVVRSKIDVFTWTDPNDKEKTERVEVTVDDLGVWITSCTGNVREEMNIDNKELAIALAKAILEGYSEK